MKSLDKKAAEYAAVKHQEQRYGEYPYTKHLKDVVDALKRFGFNTDEFKAAGWLHDTVEDTGTRIEDIRNEFGDKVADLVYRVTNEQGKNRAERHLKTYPKIKNSNDALALKLADRIANVEQSLIESDSMLEMYRKEYPAFKTALYTKGIHEKMWHHLDLMMEKQFE